MKLHCISDTQPEGGLADLQVRGSSADPQGPGIVVHFDGNTAMIPIRKNKSPYAEQKVLKSVWIS